MSPIAYVVASWSTSSTTLTVAGVKNGSLTVGQRLSGTGITAGTYIASFLVASGGTGTYTLSSVQSSSGNLGTAVHISYLHFYIIFKKYLYSFSRHRRITALHRNGLWGIPC